MKMMKENDVKKKKFLQEDREEKEKMWKEYESVFDLESFNLKITNFKIDLEEYLPKLIQNNPKLEKIYIHFLEIEEFNNENLKFAFQIHKIGFKTIQFHFDADGDEDLYESCYLTSFLACFEDCKISSLFLHNIHFNEFNLKSLEKIKGLDSIDFFVGFFDKNIEYNYSFEASNVIIMNIQTSNQDLVSPLIKCFPNLENLNLDIIKMKIDFLKLKNSLKDINLKVMSLRLPNKCINEVYLKDIFNNVSEFLTLSNLSKLDHDVSWFSFLKDQKFLKRLELVSLNNFEDFDIFMNQTKSLKTLKIYRSPFIIFSNVQENVEFISKGLFNNKSLEKLYFRFDLKGNFKYLFFGLKESRNIKELTLSCSLNDEDCFLIKDYFLNNDSLTSIDLSINKINNKAMEHLYYGLKTCNNLKTLILSDNFIGDMGCEYIKELLISTQSLKSLDVSNCEFKDQGVNYISEGLLLNSSLTQLNCKSLYAFDLKDFKKNIFYNQYITELKLNESRIYYEIQNILQRNLSFIKTMKVQRMFNLDINIYFF